MRRLNQTNRPKSPRTISEADLARPPQPFPPAYAGRRKKWSVALLGGVSLAAVLAVGGAAWWHFNNDQAEEVLLKIQGNALDYTRQAGLQLNSVSVTGRHRTDPDALLAALGVERGGPTLALSPVEARENIEALPWVRSATVERRLPNAVHVQLEERLPLALWQNNGHFSLVDPEGVAIPVEISRFQHLPVIVGPDAPRFAAEFLEMLNLEPELRARVKAAVHVSGRRWNVMLDNLNKGVEVRLPDQNADAAWRRLAQLDREENLLKREVAMIDMRLTDRLVVRLVDGSQALTPGATSHKGGQDA